MKNELINTAENAVYEDKTEYITVPKEQIVNFETEISVLRDELSNLREEIANFRKLFYGQSTKNS